MFFQPVIIRCFSKTTKLQRFFPVKNETKIVEAFPKQHPKKIDSPAHEILKLEKPPTYITKAKEVPFELYESKNTPFESPSHSRALEVALIGAPNVGKSALFNRFVGGNVSAVSNKSNTTDEALKGVYTNIESRTQIIFNDTPGIIKLFKSSGHFVTRAWDTLETCDKALFVVDSVKRIDDPIREALRRLKRMKLGGSFLEKMRKLRDVQSIEELTPEFIEELAKEEEQNDKFQDQTIPTYLLVNKIDLCTNKRKLKELINELEQTLRFEKVFFTSAETGYGLNEVLKSLEEDAFSRPWELNPKCKSDLSEVDELEQLMRSFIYERFYKEVPYRIGIDVREFRIRSDGVCKVEYKLDVENESQVPIILGTKGRNIRYLKERIECELAKKYQKEVQVNILVTQRRESLAYSNDTVQEVVPPGYGMKKAKEEVEALKKREISLKALKR